ncbi:MAG TPA: hypothetical protein VM577_05465 [Anaerovoracaceae bacterium]|nr:hypothetical protein [Anaerovoracaceae bacterium]
MRKLYIKLLVMIDWIVYNTTRRFAMAIGMSFGAQSLAIPSLFSAIDSALTIR